MKELYVKFDFNVRIEIDEEDAKDTEDIRYFEAINDQVIGWWIDINELPDYDRLEEE